MGVFVKICGITSLPDALMALDAGADALGFVFYEKSPRHILLAEAASIIHQLPRPITRVGLFVNASQELVNEAIDRCGLNLLQFHGDESPHYCMSFGISSMKAFRIRNAESLEALPDYPTQAWLLDAYTPNQFGGTGETFNWELAVEAKRWERPIFLAGGLTPDNVAEAVTHVRPYAVDVSSGVESSPGRKDPEKVRAFIDAAKAA